MPVDEPHRIVCRLDSLSVLKNQRAKAVRFSTLTAIWEALECQPGDLFALADPS